MLQNKYIKKNILKSIQDEIIRHLPKIYFLRNEKEKKKAKTKVTADKMSCKLSECQNTQRMNLVLQQSLVVH